MVLGVCGCLAWAVLWAWAVFGWLVGLLGLGGCGVGSGGGRFWWFCGVGWVFLAGGGRLPLFSVPVRGWPYVPGSLSFLL